MKEFIPSEKLAPLVRYFQDPVNARKDIANLWAIRQELREIMDAKPAIQERVQPLFDSLNRMLGSIDYNPKANFPPYLQEGISEFIPGSIDMDLKIKMKP